MKKWAISGVLAAVLIGSTVAFTMRTTRQPQSLKPVARKVVMPKKTSRVRLSAASPKTTLSARAKYLVLIVLDGARPDYFSVPGIPHIQSLVKNGVQYSNAWAGLLESETPTGHAAIATGSEPRQDGIPSFDWANQDNLPVSLFNPDVVRAGAMEKVMAQSGAPTIAGLVHKQNPGAKVVALSGHKYYAADAMGGPNADAIMYYAGTPKGKFAPTAIPGHVPPKGILSTPGLTYPTTKIPLGIEDHLTMQLADTTFRRMHQQVTLINVPEFDWPLGHVLGGSRDPAAVRTLMQGFDHDLAQLESTYGEAGVLNKTLFVITADHGFSPIYHTVTDSALKKAVTDTGTSIVSETFHTASYMWIKNESVAAEAAQNIAGLRNPYIQSVYFREVVPGGSRYVRASGPGLLTAHGTEAANQYLLKTFNGPTGPDIVVLFKEDVGSLTAGQESWKGDHGGGSWQSQHIPLIFSGPGVRHGAVSQQPARLMDIAPTALSLMGMVDTGMSGTPLTDSMESQSTSATAKLKALSWRLMPVITSLKQESKLEVAAGK